MNATFHDGAFNIVAPSPLVNQGDGTFSGFKMLRVPTTSSRRRRNGPPLQWQYHATEVEVSAVARHPVLDHTVVGFVDGSVEVQLLPTMPSNYVWLFTLLVRFQVYGVR
mmetsp:Transcript_18776/g.47215  ORF Transcript_18776/g.47215 Transcript_18776/m.47215 type:complete len:109 (+) Transcript_18776:294-620(+)